MVSDVVDPDKVSEMCSSFRKKASQVLDIDIVLGMAPLTETYSDPKVWFNDARTALKQIKKVVGSRHSCHKPCKETRLRGGGWNPT